MIRSWYLSTHAGLLAEESDPPRGGLVELVTDLTGRLGASVAGHPARAVRGTPRWSAGGK